MPWIEHVYGKHHSQIDFIRNLTLTVPCIIILYAEIPIQMIHWQTSYEIFALGSFVFLFVLSKMMFVRCYCLRYFSMNIICMFKWYFGSIFRSAHHHKMRNNWIVRIWAKKKETSNFFFCLIQPNQENSRNVHAYFVSSTDVIDMLGWDCVCESVICTYIFFLALSIATSFCRNYSNRVGASAMTDINIQRLL